MWFAAAPSVARAVRCLEDLGCWLKGSPRLGAVKLHEGVLQHRLHPTHLSELLNEQEGIDIGRTTLRRILLDAGLSGPRRRRAPKHRVRRQCVPRERMLIQMDGSHHPWLGSQVLPFALLIVVDDATGPAPGARFYEIACWRRDSGAVTITLCSVSLMNTASMLQGRAKATRPRRGIKTLYLIPQGC